MSDTGEEREDEFDGRPELVKARARSYFAQQLTMWGIIVYMLITMTISAFNAIVSFQTRDTLLGCVEPKGECYQEGNERTAGFIQQLIEANELDEVATRKIVLAAIVCDDQLPRNASIKAIEACVKEETEGGNNE